jgi:hypothetical protein
MQAIRSLSPAQVRQFLRGTNLADVSVPTADGAAAVFAHAPTAKGTPESDYWSQWGGIAAESGDPNTFPLGVMFSFGTQYDENIVFNGGPNAGSSGIVVPGSATAAPIANPNNAPPYVSSAIFTPFPFSCGTGSAQPSPVVCPTNPKRAALLIQNLSGVTNLFVNWGAPANTNLGFLIVPGGAALFDQFTPINDVYVFFNNAVAQNGVIFEGTRQF